MNKQEQRFDISNYKGLTWLTQVSHPYCIVDKIGNIHWVNEAFCLFLSLNKEEIVHVSHLKEALILNRVRFDLWCQHRDHQPEKFSFSSIWHQVEELEWELFPLQLESHDIPESYYLASCKKIGSFTQKSPQLLSTILDNKHLMYVVITDEEGKYTYMNDRFCRRFNVRKEEQLGKSSMYSIATNDQMLAVQVSLASLNAPGIPQSVILRKPLPSSGYVTTFWEFTAIIDEQTHERKIVCLGIDITDMIKKQNDYERLVNNLIDGLLVINSLGIITYVSPSWIQNYGYSSGETTGKHINQFLAESDYPKTLKVMHEVAENDYPMMIDHHMTSKEGEFRISETKIGYDIDTQNWIFMCRDVTEKRKDQQLIKLLKSVVEHAHDAVLITKAEPIDKDGNGPEIVYANNAFYQMTGYEKAEIIGKTPRILQGPKTDRNELDRLKRALKNWETIEIEIINYRKDQSEFWVNFIVTPIADKDGWFTHWVSIQRNVTERKIAELELIHAKEAAEKASMAKSDFLSTMSHEIRTPLNAIIGMTGVLFETSLNGEQLAYLKTIRQGGEVLLSTINDILDYSKIETGNIELEEETFSLLSPVEETLELLAFKAFQKGLEFFYQTKGNLPDIVKGDITRIRQILVNLCSNAIKFTENGEVVISVQEYSRDGDSITLLFAVKDTGIGIPENKINSLFDSFKQVDASTTRKYGGTGLGLTITKKLVELLGGKIWVESSMENGSTFFFTIVFPNISLKRPHIQENLTFSKAKKIHLINAHPALSKQIAYWLMVNGLSVEENHTLQYIIKEINQFNDSDLIIIDKNVSGVEKFGTKLIRKFPNLPVLLISPLVQINTGKDNNFFSDFIQKPLRKELFLKKVHDILYGQAEKRLPQKTSERINLSAYKILLVEDNKINQQVAQKILQKFHAKVEIAANGQEAIDYLLLRNFDLVLMDMQMPILDGLDATKLIRENEQIQQPIILAMTANNTTLDRERCLNAGMDDFISKPVKLEVLSKYLEKWLV